MQKHLLRKSGAIRKLENAIQRLRLDNTAGLDNILEIIGFISEHLNFIPIARISTRSKIIRNNNGTSDEAIPTIKGVYIVDQYLPSSAWNPQIGDLLDIGIAIKKLLSSGLPLDLGRTDENDEIGEPEYWGKIVQYQTIKKLKPPSIQNMKNKGSKFKHSPELSLNNRRNYN